MNFVEKINDGLSDSLNTFKLFERIIAIVCIAIPALLFLADEEYNGFRASISNYVYMYHSYVFGMLLSIASMLFIYNGVVYFKNASKFHMSEHGKWYNVVLGLSLLGLILFPPLQFPIPHYIFVCTFFIGNALVIGLFHKKNNRNLSVILAVLTVAFFVIHFFGLISLFWAEWFSLIVIGIHFILESIRVTTSDKAEQLQVQKKESLLEKV